MGLRTFSRGGERLIIGHRGSAGTHPENTLGSFAAALDSGAEAVEADVRMTSDGVPVIIHDPQAGEGSGLVHEMTLEQLRADKAEIPTLHDLLELVDLREGRVVLEIKNLPGDPGYDPAHEGAVDALAEELAEFPGMEVLVVSFNPRSIERCREKVKGAATGFLTTAAMDPRVALRYARDAGHEWVLPNVSAVLSAGEDLVSEIHDAGVCLGTWTVDDPAEVARLLAWGVDGLVTNLPADAVAIRNGS